MWQQHLMSQSKHQVWALVKSCAPVRLMAAYHSQVGWYGGRGEVRESQGVDFVLQTQFCLSPHASADWRQQACSFPSSSLLRPCLTLWVTAENICKTCVYVHSLGRLSVGATWSFQRLGDTFPPSSGMPRYLSK